MVKFIALALEEDGMAMHVASTKGEALTWLFGRSEDCRPSGTWYIFEGEGDVVTVDYDSYSDTHIHCTGGEATPIYCEDSQTINEDVYGLRKPDMTGAPDPDIQNDHIPF